MRATRGADTGTFIIRREPDGVSVLTGEPAQLATFVPAGRPVALPGATVVLTPAAASVDRIVVRVDGFETAVTALTQALSIERAGRESQVITVRYKSSDPALARALDLGPASRVLLLVTETPPA